MTFQEKLQELNFLKQYWQKQPLLLRDAFTNEVDIIDGNTLAGLACDDNIESRMIFANQNQNNWTCKYGHFTEDDFSKLDEENWTLLVQSVDHFIPEIKTLQNYFNFIPKWRLDDVMISYSPQGGGVGPHFDYYDVFLIQTSGSREWKIGQHCNSETKLREHEDLKLLKTFEEIECFELQAGDVLYIPAGISHWGTATSQDCITTSIGFRAPSHQELLENAGINLGKEYSDDQRYRDIDLTQDKDNYMLSLSIQENILSAFPEISETKPKAALLDAFTSLITEPRHTELFIETDQQFENNAQKIKHHPNSRFLYIEDSSKTRLFVNAEEHLTDLSTAKSICYSDYSDWENLDKNLIQSLVQQGYLLIQD